jgi:uncharacterized protein (DUF433 family)
MNEPAIVSDPRVMKGKPVVAGTRVTVESILEKLGSGETIEALLESHPRLTREGVLAALRSPLGLSLQETPVGSHRTATRSSHSSETSRPKPGASLGTR